jgi:hypothetical protein
MEQSGRNQWQLVANGKALERLKQAEIVATGCDQLRPGLDGKEGVDGSSPLEGYRLFPARRAIPLSGWAAGSRPSVHRASTNIHRGGVERVEQPDHVLASVAGEVAVVTVDHGQACTHVTGELEGGDAGTEREGGAKRGRRDPSLPPSSRR